MHTMQESSHSHDSANGALSDGFADPYAQQVPKVEGMTMAEMLATVGGMLLPLVLQVGHSH